MRDKLVKIMEGKGVMQDLMDIERWSGIMKANRCGLGHTALNPILSTLKNFRHLYLERIQKEVEFDTGFRLDEAVKIGKLVTNR
jgi:NADH:ubiquinone oxidoreductase subunit F (NADH-binding)